MLGLNEMAEARPRSPMRAHLPSGPVNDPRLRVVVVEGVSSGIVDGIVGVELVATVHRGREGLSTVLRTEPDVLVIDTDLPDISGIDLLAQLRAAHNMSDVIVVATSPTRHTVSRALRLGAAYYVVRPVLAETIGARLGNIADTRRGLRSQSQFDQFSIDRIYAQSRSVPAGRLPKGITRSTLDLVVERLRSARRPLSAAEIAAGVGISRVTARRYLEYLVRAGLVDVSVHYSRTVGRPRRIYRFRD